MITVQLKIETTIKTPIVSLPSIVAFSKANRNAPLAKKGAIKFIVIDYLLKSGLVAEAHIHDCPAKSASHKDLARFLIRRNSCF